MICYEILSRFATFFEILWKFEKLLHILRFCYNLVRYNVCFLRVFYFPPTAHSFLIWSWTHDVQTHDWTCAIYAHYQRYYVVHFTSIIIFIFWFPPQKLRSVTINYDSFVLRHHRSFSQKFSVFYTSRAVRVHHIRKTLCCKKSSWNVTILLC